MKKGFKIVAFVLIGLIVVYLLGPAPSAPKLSKQLPAVPASAMALEQFIKEQEAKHKLKPNNEARITAVTKQYATLSATGQTRKSPSS